MNLLYIAVTDPVWFEFHRARRAEEVNFWRPGGSPFRALDNGDPLVQTQLFLFRVKAPIAKIAGGGFFLRYQFVRLSEAWDTYEEGNGAPTREQFEARIRPLMSPDRAAERDPNIGCILLTNVFYLPEELWIETPWWHRSIVQGKSVAIDSPEGRRLYQQLTSRTALTEPVAAGVPVLGEPNRFGAPVLRRPRLGQRGFRLEVTARYHRRCAMTGERSLPALEAAHIRPYTEEGPHLVSNGLLLRADVHRLFEKGYITVAPDLRVEVSRRLREEFENGRDYYVLDGKPLLVLPAGVSDRPARDFLAWHNEHRYKG